MAGVFAERSKKNCSFQLETQRPGLNARNSVAVLPIVDEVLNSPGQPLNTATRAFFEPRLGQDFSQVRVHSDVNAEAAQEGFTHFIHKNAAADEEPIGDEPDSGERGQEFVGRPFPSPFEETPPEGKESIPGIEPLEEGGEKKAKCPSKTVVEKTIDMTPDGIKKGYRTGYGAVAVMHVEPDSTNWDGAQIVESLKQTNNTCPKEFKISPCSGNSTFTVGAEGKSSVLGMLEAKSNRFYDFHITRWNKGSLLHDRNSDNVDSCHVECEQSYSCDGVVIGKHTVTRNFTMGKSGSRDVTLVAVAKK